jgi:enoyl-CoA hydratase/carnithine racemase
MTSNSGQHVRASTDRYVSVVTLSHPPLNFVSATIIRELADLLSAADADDSIRAIVLQTNGKHFCSGADFSVLAGEHALTPDGINALYQQAVRLYAVRKPIVAAIQGAAVGAGLGLALVADFRIASPDARFVANFVKLGYHPGFGISLALPRLVGEQKAALMLLTGRRIKGDEALAWGLADEVVQPALLHTTALRLAHELAENAPLAVVATRKTLRAELVDTVAAQLSLEYRQQMLLHDTADFAEGIRAVAERRPGRFVAR